uniref:DUF569 domain-containing protein n=1 Tax=Aegilops tauschii TaxID=37682 RepID=R7W9Q4_AEGTA
MWWPLLYWLGSSDSFSAPLHKVQGRAIHYHIADDKGDVDDDIERRSFTFNGSNLEELTQKLQEETGIDDLIVCTRSPISGKLTPLLLQLPPNNAAMHIVLVRESSKDRESAKDSRHGSHMIQPHCKYMDTAMFELSFSTCGEDIPMAVRLIIFGGKTRSLQVEQWDAGLRIWLIHWSYTSFILASGYQRQLGSRSCV